MNLSKYPKFSKYRSYSPPRHPDVHERLILSPSRYTSMSSQNPHLILTTFLPVLLFESAFAMDVHIFYKMFWQVVLLAVFGLAVATALSGIMAKMVFVDYQWTWLEALLFGSIVSATDPVAVVALLNDLGESTGLFQSQE